MEDWGNVRAFGLSGKRSIVRPSAYALILNRAGELAVVRSANGTFLPGGGIDQDETAEQAVQREALEECGFRVHVGKRVNRAIQFVSTVPRKKSVEKRSEFFEAEIETENASEMEPGHETFWVRPEEASRYLTHASHAWVVSEWRKH